jgi:hypothetical protein
MKVKRLIIQCLCTSALTLACSGAWALCGSNSCNSAYSSDFCAGSCGPYSCTTNADTSPSICDSSCADPCDLSCTNDNVNYQGCGDNCVLP